MDLSKKYIFRMMHIENVAHCLNFGITHKNSIHKNPNYVAIGDDSIITTRNLFPMRDGKKLGDYIPFYFGVRTPMLYVIQKGFNSVKITEPENIVYCVSNIQILINKKINFIFSDGQANHNFTKTYDSSFVEKIDDLLDFDAINSKFWKSETDLDLKRRKEAEILLEEDLPKDAILGWIVYNEQAKNTLIKKGVKIDNIIIKPNYYF